MKIKNVIIINDFDYAQGGASTVAVDTANILAEMDINVVFFSVVHSENNGLDKRITNYTLNDQESLKMNNKLRGIVYGIHNFRCEKELDELLNHYSTEDTIAHVHGWTKACSSIVFKVLKRRKFKTVVTLHDYFSVCPNGALLNFRTTKCCDLKCNSLSCFFTNCDSRNRFFKIYRFIREKRYYRDIDFSYVNCIFVSNLQMQLITKQREVGKKSAVLISKIEELDCNASCEKGYDYVYIGRDSGEKGIDLFIELAKRTPEKNFLIVGDYMRDKTPNVKVTGWVTELEVERYLKQSKCLVVPSLLPEPFGLVVVKAVAFGVKCLVSDNIGATDYISSETGLAFEQGSIEDLEDKAKAIETLVTKKCPNLLNPKEKYIENLIAFYNEAT